MGISLMDFGSHDLFGEKLKMRRGRARKEVKWETGLKQDKGGQPRTINKCCNATLKSLSPLHDFRVASLLEPDTEELQHHLPLSSLLTSRQCGSCFFPHKSIKLQCEGQTIKWHTARDDQHGVEVTSKMAA